MRKGVALMLFLYIGVFASQVQPDERSRAQDLSALVKTYRDLFRQTKTLIADLDTEETVADWNEFYTAPQSVPSAASLQTSPKNSWFRDLDLKWASDAAYNFSPGIAENEDVFYKTRISTGLDWAALGEGSLRSRNLKKTLLLKEVQKDSLQNVLRKNKLTTTTQLFLIQQVFDEEKLGLLKTYDGLLKKLYSFELQKHRLRLINDAELYKAKNAFEDTSVQIKTLEDNHYTSRPFQEEKFFKILPAAKIQDLPALDTLSLDRLLPQEQRILQLDKEMLTSKNLKEQQHLDLKLKVRYNYYSSRDDIGRTFASVGASLDLPVSPQNNGLLEYELNSRELQLMDSKKALKNGLYEISRSYNTLKEEIALLENKNRYIKQLMAVAEEAEKANGSPALYVGYAREFIENKVQILEKKNLLWQKYILFMKTAGLPFSATPAAAPTQSARTADAAAPENRGKETYLWTSFFNEKSNEYLLGVLQQWHISTLFLSVSKSTDPLKLQAFQALAAQNQIKLYRLIGENSYANKDNGFADLVKVLEAAKTMGFAGIHLDIEPHTFPDYKENIELYTQRQIVLFEKARQWCDENGMELAASVPMHLPSEVAVCLAQNSITAYIMAYDTLSLEKKMNKTLAIRNILQDRYRWVFRINDFSDYSQLMTAEQVVSENNIPDVSYYDLSQMDLFKD